MTTQMDEFLEKLAALCEAYNATFENTTDDDGIHISLNDEEIFIGFLCDSDAPGLLRDAVALNGVAVCTFKIDAGE